MVHYYIYKHTSSFDSLCGTQKEFLISTIFLSIVPKSVPITLFASSFLLSKLSTIENNTTGWITTFETAILETRFWHWPQNDYWTVRICGIMKIRWQVKTVIVKRFDNCIFFICNLIFVFYFLLIFFHNTCIKSSMNQWTCWAAYGNS